LRPLEEEDVFGESMHGLLWSPDGQYLVSGAVNHHAAGLSIFNVRTGRHRGQLTGCYRDNGIVLSADGSQLAAGSMDGKILFWDFPTLMKQIKEVEKSLEPSTGPWSRPPGASVDATLQGRIGIHGRLRKAPPVAAVDDRRTRFGEGGDGH